MKPKHTTDNGTIERVNVRGHPEGGVYMTFHLHAANRKQRTLLALYADLYYWAEEHKFRLGPPLQAKVRQTGEADAVVHAFLPGATDPGRLYD